MPPKISYRYAASVYPVVQASSTPQDINPQLADLSVRQSVLPYSIPVLSAEAERQLAQARAVAESKPATEQVEDQLVLPRHDKATRMAALMRMRELWQESGNGYVDGVEYQKEMRSEWR